MTSFPRLLTVALLAGLISSSVWAAKNYYKWVDEDGVTHYTTRKPLNVEAEVISVSTGLPRDDSGQEVKVDDEPASTGTSSTQTKTAAAAPVDDKDPERCEAAQKNLKIINENARIRERQEDGTTRFLTPEEIDQRKKQAEKAIEESC